MPSRMSNPSGQACAGVQKNRMRPVHPGEIWREGLDALGLLASALSKALDVPVNRVKMTMRGQRRVTADPALRLAHYSGRGGLVVFAPVAFARLAAQAGFVGFDDAFARGSPSQRGYGSACNQAVFWFKSRSRASRQLDRLFLALTIRLVARNHFCRGTWVLCMRAAGQDVEAGLASVAIPTARLVPFVLARLLQDGPAGLSPQRTVSRWSRQDSCVGLVKRLLRFMASPPAREGIIHSLNC